MCYNFSMTKKFLVIILTFFLIFINSAVEAAQSYTKKDLSVNAVDGFNLRATVTYPKVKGQQEFKTVVLLHSLGYNSQWWATLPDELLSRGYAVLAIDLRGHGKSVYNARLAKTSWKNLKNSGYAKYPEDILSIINSIVTENPKRVFFNNWAIVGADIGAASGIIAADKFPIDPKTIVMISPIVKSKSLYVPVSIAHLDATDFLAISGTGDNESKIVSKYLSKFAQAEYLDFTSESKSTGMLILKNDEGLAKMISEWIFEYLN